MELIEELKNKLKESKDGIKLRIKVIANAKKNSIEPFEEGIVKIKIDRPAVEGKANKAIIEYISEILQIPKSNVIIIKGEKSSLKDLHIIPKKHII